MDEQIPSIFELSLSLSVPFSGRQCFENIGAERRISATIAALVRREGGAVRGVYECRKAGGGSRRLIKIGVQVCRAI